VTHFLELGLLERHDDQVQLTLLGRACGQASLAFDSGMRLIEVIRSTSGRELTAFKLVGLIQMLPEADSLYTPVRKKARTESIRVSQAASRFGETVVQALRQWVGDEIAFWGRCKRAAILAEWMEGASIQEIERTFSVPFGGQVQSGDITRFADATRFHLRSARQILSALLTMTPEQEIEFDLVGRQLEFGVPADLVPLMEPPLLLSRGETLALGNAAVRSREALAKLESGFLTAILGERRAKAVQFALASISGQQAEAAAA
jgi:helicase